ncbi:MAG: 4'-phosphopantetheinyl transferase family protein [Terriglobales bacterium]
MAALDLYWFDLEADAAHRAVWRTWLSSEERARADRLVVPLHGWRYTAAHAHLRWLLAQRLGYAPADLEFERGPHGKPSLRGLPLHFNLSDSGTLGLAGVHATIELGVDIEAVRADRDALRLARRFFTDSETAWLEAQPAADRAHAFCRLWTCKEAWMKADGRGLALPLHHAEVTFSAGAAGLCSVGPPARAWYVRELKLAGGYAAAVVMAGPPEAVTVAKLTIPA